MSDNLNENVNPSLNLFDANGCFGCSSTSAPIYPKISDLLSQLDRLGVSRSVVWNVESQESNCPWSNRRLIDEIENTPGAKGRLIPSFTVSPSLLYERGAMAELKKNMKEYGTNALRFNRGLTNVAFTLRQIEPVIEELKCFKPVLFLAEGQTNAEDILYFTERFPDVSLVISQVGWGKYIFAFDLLRKRKNILLETSFLHTFGAIEMVVEEFGAERIVFGLGPKPHNGAAIAAIARAELSQGDRDLVMHGNLERLLGIAGIDDADVKPIGIDNECWRSLIGGEVLSEDLIDAHGHLGPGGGYILREHTMQGQIRQALDGMDKLGISTMIVSSMQALMSDPVKGNLEMEEAFSGQGERFKGYFSFNPYYEKELLAIMDGCFERGVFVGFKTLCDYWKLPITDPRFESMFEYANRYRLPILNHTWGGPYNSPAMFTEIVKKYPDVSFLLAHAGGGDDGRREAEKIVCENDNVYIEWCGTFCSLIPFEETLAKVGSDKVIFGTDGVSHSLIWELGRLLSLNVPEADITPILSQNMKKILARRIK